MARRAQGSLAHLVGAAAQPVNRAIRAAVTSRAWITGATRREWARTPLSRSSNWAPMRTVRTPIGRKLRPRLLGVGTPLARVRPRDITAAGIERVPRTVGTRGGLPLLEDGRALEVANVVWCTGFRPDFGWIDLPVVGPDGEPRSGSSSCRRSPRP